MAVMLPRLFPHDLRKKPQRVGEADVFHALRSGLSDDWLVLYDRSIPQSRRRIDFLCLNERRGVLAIEVKGGQVHAFRGWFRQRIRPSGLRKRIDPFGQLKLGVRAALAAAALSPEALPVALVIWFPHMGHGSMPWKTAAPHIWTREVNEVGGVDRAASSVLGNTVPDAEQVRVLRRALVPGWE